VPKRNLAKHLNYKMVLFFSRIVFIHNQVIS
jgi:hypothetical protein